jgi:MoaA/NifB/PqqE/SkfB family radical SAM enzyme
MKTDILHVVHAFNYKKILHMVLDAKEMGADRVWFQLLHVSDFNRYLRLRPEQVAETRFLLNEAKKLAAEIEIDIADFMDLQLKHVRSDGTWSKNIFERFGCLVGWYFSYINVAGEISFCCGNKIIDDLKTQDYKTLWQSPLYETWRKKARRFDWNDNITGKNGVKLLDEFCFNCDNHNFNSEMLQLLADFNVTDLLPEKKGFQNENQIPDQSPEPDTKKLIPKQSPDPDPAPEKIITEQTGSLLENRRGSEGWYLNVSLTESCQFRCRFCDTWKNKPEPGTELDTAAWLEAIDTFHRLSPNARINFSGGEPLLKKELPEILRFCHHAGIKTSISTNGGSFTEKKAAEIACSGIDIIGISVDGYGDLHDELRGAPGAFDKIQKAIKWIRQDNKNTEINLLTIILKDNLNDIRKIVKWVEEDADLTHVHFQALSILRDCRDEKITDHPLWPEKAAALELMDELIDHRQNQEDKNLRPCTISNIIAQLKAMRRYFADPDCFTDQVCTIYKSGYTLNAKGDLFFCPFMESIGNITREPLAEILSEPRLSVQKKKIQACRNTACHLRINCCFEA